MIDQKNIRLSITIFLAFCFSMHVIAQTWDLRQKIYTPFEPNFTGENDKFGTTFDIYDSIIVVGAPADPNESSYDGAAYVYVRNHNFKWVLSQKLVGDPRNYGYGSDQFEFGSSISISGNILAIGSKGARVPSTSGSLWPDVGLVYLFKKKNTGSWDYHQKIQPYQTNDSLYTFKGFGSIVTIDSNNLIISGNSKVYYYSDSSGVYKKIQTIEAGPTFLPTFCKSCVVSDDQFLVITKSNERTDNTIGAVYIYELNAHKRWEFVQKIIPVDTFSGSNIGTNAAISGNHLLLGSVNENVQGTAKGRIGAIYCFQWDINLNKFVFFQRIVADSNMTFSNDLNGPGISIYKDKFLAYALDTFDHRWENVAAALFYKFENGQWIYDYKINPKPKRDYFNWGMKYSNDKVVLQGGSVHDEFPWEKDVEVSSYIYILDTIGATTTSIESNVNRAFNLFPNPSKGFVTVVFSKVMYVVEFNVYNATGQMVDSFEINSKQSTEIELKGPPGFYMISMVSEGEFFGTKKILKIQ